MQCHFAKRQMGIKRGAELLKAIILSAGQGKRLLPMTSSMPKCMLEVAGKTIIERQIDTLHDAGVDDIVIVTGYGADKVDALVKAKYGNDRVRTLYNPRYATSDNLVSCWWARGEMKQDFLLLNGDTLFETGIAQKLLSAPDTPVTVTINVKEKYDSDDMKVIVHDNRLVRVGKDLPVDEVDGESIGFIRFMGDGPAIFRSALEEAVEDPSSSGRWYLSVIDSLAAKMDVRICAITGMSWCEVDYPEDLSNASMIFSALQT